MWSVLSFCYTLLVILQKNRVNTLYAGHVKFRWTWQQRKGKGDWRQRMSYDVDFVQAETQLFSGGPCHALWCEPEHYVKIIQLLDENFGSMHQWVSPLVGQDFDSGKCASYFQEPLSWHTCHHRFCGDWDWPLSQPDTQSLTWFDYKRRTFKSCIIYPGWFTSALQPVGLWRGAHFWQLWFFLS